MDWPVGFGGIATAVIKSCRRWPIIKGLMLAVQLPLAAVHFSEISIKRQHWTGDDPILTVSVSGRRSGLEKWKLTVCLVNCLPTTIAFGLCLIGQRAGKCAPHRPIATTNLQDRSIQTATNANMPPKIEFRYLACFSELSIFAMPSPTNVQRVNATKLFNVKMADIAITLAVLLLSLIHI